MLNSLVGIIASGGSEANSYESIATVTVGAGGSASASFTSIPSTYQHLQIRGIARQSATGATQPMLLTANGVTSGYAVHNVRGNGTSALATGDTAQGNIYLQDQLATASNNASVFSAFVIDLLDYANTNKNKTFRIFMGIDDNGSGRVALNSGLFQSTSAVTSLTLSPNSGNFVQYSSFALYGIKG